MAAFTKAGVDCLELSTENVVHEDLIHFIVQRQRFLRQAGKGRHHV